MNVSRPRLAGLVAAAAMAATPPPPPAAQPPPHGPSQPTGGACPVLERVTRLGQWFPPSRILTPAIPVQQVVAPQNPQFSPVAMRLQFQVNNAGDRRWRIVVRDPDLRTLAVLAADDFPNPTGTAAERWTGILRFPRVVLELEDASPGVAIAVASGIALPDIAGANVFSIRGSTPEWNKLYGPDVADSGIKRTGEAVGMMQSSAFAGAAMQPWCCSGVMISPSLFLTNWHCGGTAAMTDEAYWTEACRNAVIDLGWDGGQVRRQLSCESVVAKDKDLDFAVLRVRPVLGDGAATRAAPARLSTGEIAPQQPVYLIHHASCDVKLVSRNCHVEATSHAAWTSGSAGPGPDITHTCDSERGSSGGGLFDATSGRLIALHHAGFSQDAQCHVEGNKAVRISEIVKKLPADLRAELNIHP
jgi:hypothetical protein